MSEEKKSFSVKLRSEKVSIENSEGVAEDYVIHEMCGDILEEYFNGQKEKTKISDDGKTVRILDYKGVYITLLNLTMTGPDEKAVPLTLLKTWPSRVQIALFKIAQELNALDPEAAEKAKND